MNFDSRESLARDSAFDAQRRDSFIRDEFAAPSRPLRDAASGRDKGLGEFYSEAEWDGPPAGGFRPQRAEIVLGVVVIALIVGSVSIWTLVSGRGAAADEPVAVAAAAPVPPPAPAVVETATPEVPSAAPATAGRSEPPARQAVAPRPAQNARPVVPPVGRVAAGRPAVASLQPPANILTPTLLNDTQLATPPTAGLRAEAGRIDAGGLNRVYSSADGDVIPPKMIVDDVPAALIVGMPRRMQSVELMVTEAGDVSRVRLLTEQRRILDTMLLSRAKMWRFTPAQRQGRPVPYRLVVLWEVND